MVESQAHVGPKIGRVSALVFGITCYALHWVAFIYMMGFLSNAVVVKAIDSGEPAEPLTLGVIINIVTILAFVVTHWVMAQSRFKAFWVKIVPLPIERSTFVLVSSVLLGLVFYAWYPLTWTVWSVEGYRLSGLIVAAYWAGWALAIYATFPINHWDLFGVRQVVLYYRKLPYTDPVGYDSIVYRVLPHPIFIGYGIVVWSTPRMSVGHLLLALFLTLFLIVDVGLARRRQSIV